MLEIWKNHREKIMAALIPMVVFCLFLVASASFMMYDGGSPGASSNSLRTSELERTWQELGKGLLAFEPHRSMTQGQPYEVRARITPSAEIDSTTGFQGPVAQELVQVSGVMRLQLLASEDKFHIEPITRSEQVVVEPHTDWLWEVTPLRHGDLSLRLIATVNLRLSDRSEEFRDVVVKTAYIQVESNRTWWLKRFWAEHWQWILGSPVVAFLIWLGTRVLKGRQRQRKAGF